MRKSDKPYYNLITFEGGFWALQFGDYDREVVVDEGEVSGLKRKDWKVVCGSNQDAIDLCNALNSKTALTA